jgi:hypothetical protein
MDILYLLDSVGVKKIIHQEGVPVSVSWIYQVFKIIKGHILVLVNEKRDTKVSSFGGDGGKV